MNLLSLLIGLVALPMALVAFLPLLGWMYWLIVPFAIAGFAIGSVGHGRAGRTLNLVVIVVGVLRLLVGHGIF